MKNAESNVSEEKKKPLIPFNLQFFGAGADDDLSDKDDDLGNGTGDGDEGDDGDQKKSGEKTFTQTQVNALLAREKKEGRRAAFRALGFKTEAEAKSALSVLNKLVQPAGAESDDNADTDNTELFEAQKRAEAAENKLACINAGVNKESIEDVLAIARTKVTDKKDLETVLVEMSKLPKYAIFFGEGSDEGDDNDTGSDPGHLKDKSGKKAGSYGQRLASSSQVKKTEGKKTYF